MSKVKYYYDSTELSYKKIKTRKRDKLKNILTFIAASFLFGLLFILLSFKFLESPKEKVLNRELENMKLNYTLLNKKIKLVSTVLKNVQQRDNNIYRLYFEVNPIPVEQRLAGFGGVNRYKILEGFDNSAMIINTSKHMDILSKELYIQSKSLDEIISLAKNKEKFLASIPAIQPIRKQDLTRLASGFGWRIDPFTKARKMHRGMDFSAPKGTPVYATGNGTVTRADNRATGFGNHIVINHGYGYETLYAHLSKYNVKKHQHVKRGDLIGFVGSTGRSTGPHLHYEIHKNNSKVNPINYYYGDLTPEEFRAMQKAAAVEGQSFD